MENIVLAIVPVRERGLVRAGLLDRPRWLHNFFNFPRSSVAFFASEFSFVCRGEVHLVWVDDLALLLQIKGLFVWFDLRLCELSVIILAII